MAEEWKKSKRGAEGGLLGAASGVVVEAPAGGKCSRAWMLTSAGEKA